MKINLYDDDERQFTDPINYPTNHGPFSTISIELNKQLKLSGHYSEPDEADFVGFNTSTNIGFKYKNKKSFIIHVWETQNTLPLSMLEIAKNSNQLIFGLSNQNSNLWKKYGFNVKTLYPGCDTDFWKQSIPKNKIFTFLHINSSSIRSGLDMTLKAFYKVFKNKKEVRLIIKDTNNSSRLSFIINELKKEGCNIIYINKRMHNYEIRDLYSQSHVCLNLMRSAAFSLCSLECSACNCLCLTGNVPANNEIINSDIGVLLNHSQIIPIHANINYFVENMGLSNSYPNLPYPEEPLFYDFDIQKYSELLDELYKNWNKYSEIDTRTEIINKWSWEKSAKTLINYLS